MKENQDYLVWLKKKLSAANEFSVLVHELAHEMLHKDRHKGRWKYRSMVGYTSCGAGTSIAPVRFFCQPEVVLLTLKSESNTE